VGSQICMRCRYCNQRLNVFKSLSGSSFCSKEHQKLYEEAEANKGLERLLQFVEKVPKPGPGKPIPVPAAKADEKPVQSAVPVPPAAPVAVAPIPQTIAAKPLDTPREQPIAGFLLDRIAPAAGASDGLNANFEIIKGDFPAGPAVLPSFKFEIAPTDFQAPAEEPPSLASWSNPEPMALDAALSVELPSVGSVRPHAPDFAMPGPDNRVPVLEGRPLFLPVSDALGLQISLQGQFDARDFANLAGLNLLLREVGIPGEMVQLAAAKSDVAVLPSPPAVEGRPLLFVNDAPGLELALNPLPREVRAPSKIIQSPAAKSDMAVLPSPPAVDGRPLLPVNDGAGLQLALHLLPREVQAAGKIAQLPAAKFDVAVLPSPPALEGPPHLPVNDAAGLELALHLLPREVRGVGKITRLPAAKSEMASLSSPPALEGRPLLPVNDAHGLQLALQAVFDTEVFANLARLNPLPREVRAASKITQLPVARSDAAVLAAPPALEGRPPLPVNDAPALQLALNPLPREVRGPSKITQLQAAKSDVAVLPSPVVLELIKSQVKESAAAHFIGTSAAMTRTGVGRKVSGPRARSPQLLATLRSSGVWSPIPQSFQEALGIGQPAIPAARLEQKAAPTPALHSCGAQFPPAAAGLSRQVFAAWKVEQCNTALSINMQRAMTRTGVARAVSQPGAQDFALLNVLRSIEILNRVFADVQNTSNPARFPISLAICAQTELAVPQLESANGRFAAVVAPSITPRNLAIRESDTTRAVGIIDTHKPADIVSPLFMPAMLAFRRPLTIGISRTARKVPPQIQAQQGSRACTVSPARQRPPDCLLPVLFWSAETGLGSAIASSGWFREGDCVVETFPSAEPALRAFSIRFEPEPLRRDLPTLAWDRTVRRLVIEACESTANFAGGEREAQRLVSSRPSGASPSKLVAKPRPLVTPLAVRYIIKLNRFTSMISRAASGVASGSSISSFPDEHQPVIALPRITDSGWRAVVCVFSPAALQPSRIEAADQSNSDGRSRPHPSPLRTQPASMLVLPGLSLRHSGIGWRANRGWAIVACASLEKQGNVKVSPGDETNLLSLRNLQEAVRVESGSIPGSATLRLSPKPPAISLEVGAGSSSPGVPSANALTRRRGPTLPAVSSQPDDLIVAGR
jgi:hypothetical protein